MNMPDVIPFSWKLGAAAAIVISAYLWHVERVGAAHTAGMKQAIADRAASDALAVSAKLKENAATAVLQAQTNTSIMKAKNEELAPVVRTIYVDRVHVGPGFCPASASTETTSTASSDSTDSSSRLVSQRTEEDIRALEVLVEQDLATGRACQSFIVQNGLTP